ncbi:NAD-dependent succinate-semialdehyde dehydrogenase, partial [Patescibacteria group bacterium]|nr:NAD-dependent succinate-semialdehyde dehydrogenase [Patescibacteria group bacterium]
EPLGVIFAVMPWNYPFWQVVRFAAPSLMAGNGGLLKHASNVPQSAALLEELFLKAGFPKGLFQNLPISIPQSGTVIDDPRVAAVTLTGSVRAGTSVGERAGRNLKKIVLELGGSDPFIVLKDADIKQAAKVGAIARLQNAGQTCIAAKRFIVEREIADVFLNALTEEFKEYTVGDPMESGVMVGPLATKSILDGVDLQVQKSVEMGAKVVLGGMRKEGKGLFYMPTILTNLKKGMPAYDEEIFGPVASIIPVESEEEAITVANDTEFGLGASIWTKDIEKAKRMATRIEAGAVFINAQVKSDPRLPFGGVKKSGHGRELGEYGVKEFVNAKTVSISRPQ